MKIDVLQLKEGMGQGAITLLDVRRRADREAVPAMIPGAVWRDPEQVGQWANELINGSVVVYCARGGSVSQAVSGQLREKGFAVSYLDGGLKAWIEHGESQT